MAVKLNAQGELEVVTEIKITKYDSVVYLRLRNDHTVIKYLDAMLSAKGINPATKHERGRLLHDSVVAILEGYIALRQKIAAEKIAAAAVAMAAARAQAEAEIKAKTEAEAAKAETERVATVRADARKGKIAA